MLATNPEAEPEADDAEIDAFFNIDVTTSPEIDFGPDDEAESPLTDNRWESYDNDHTYCYTKWRQRIDVNNAVIGMIKLRGHPIFTSGEDIEEEAEVMLIMEELKKRSGGKRNGHGLTPRIRQNSKNKNL